MPMGILFKQIKIVLSSIALINTPTKTLLLYFNYFRRTDSQICYSFINTYKFAISSW